MIGLYILVSLIALILIVAALAGTGWHFERSVHINAPVQSVWPHVNSLGALNTWNPWLGGDPQIKQTFTGTDGTPGATYSWDSDIKNVGAGNQTIVGINAPAELTTKINFIRPFKGVADAYIRLTEENGGTSATWGIISSTPYPVNIIKVFGLIEKNMNRDFTAGLNKLKAICEK